MPQNQVSTLSATDDVRASAPTPSILVVDADADTRALYCCLFARVGYDVSEAADGRDALTKALVGSPTLVVTEIRLPFIDGYALCAILRRDYATADVPILVVTADARPLQVDRAHKAGANSVLIKPSGLDTILNETQRLLAHAHDLRARSATTRATAAALFDKSADLLARSATHRRTSLITARHRFTTITPPASPPVLRCPSCDRPLGYERSHVGGVNDHHPEQWDYFACPACGGTFRYRQRTRKLQRVAL